MKKTIRLSIYFGVILMFLSTQIQANNKDTLKVMTYNIWNGFNWSKDLQRKTKVVEWIKSKRPDVLALQELCGYTPEKLESDAKKWGHQYSLLLKTKGYPVGITSKKPIVLKERVLEGMWHDMLHCETYGIDFFIVHLSPSDYKTRKKESDIIIKRIQKITNDSFIVLGDFNAHSPFDGDYLQQNKQILNKYLKNDLKASNKYKNTLNNNYDYSVVSSILAIPTIDVCHSFVVQSKRYTYPTPALIGRYLTKENANDFNERVDYILASPKLAKNCINAVIYNNEITYYLSDHFPVVAEFILNK